MTSSPSPTRPDSDQASALSDDEFDVEDNSTANIITTLDRLKQFSYYLVENVEVNLNLCLKLLEERDATSKPNSTYTNAASKLLLAVPKVGSALGNALAKGEIVVFDKIDKRNSRTLADLVYYFSDNKEEMRVILIESAIDIFFSFESQFMKLNCNGGPKRAMQKLAKDAADRIFNYFLENEQKKDVTRTVVTKGALFGESRRNRAGVREGKSVMDGETKWKTCQLYSKTGIVLVEEEAFFKNENCKTEKYGHRRLLFWEDPLEIRNTWELETGFDLPHYNLTTREDHLKMIKDYIMTKNPDDEAKLERKNYSEEALEDRRVRHEEVLKTFQEHFKDLLEDLEQQYRIIVGNQNDTKTLVEDVSKDQKEEKVFHREINTKLEEIRNHINETKMLIERSETDRMETVVVQTQASSSGSGATLTVEQVKEMIRRQENKDVKAQLTDFVREGLRKNDPTPRIKNEVRRSLRKLGF